MLIAGLTALKETDFKKIVALSTLRQLGLMFMTLGRGNPLYTLFHLIIHALFKSTLFITRGFIIHNTNNSQDTRFTGAQNINSPFTLLLFSATNMALCGFPYLRGFFSKDLIMENTFRHSTGLFVYLIATLRVALTLLYRTRAMLVTSNLITKAFPTQSRETCQLTLFCSSSVLAVLTLTAGFMFLFFILPDNNMILLTNIEKRTVLVTLGLSFLFYKTKTIKVNKTDKS